jgi:hypothetical protein
MDAIRTKEWKMFIVLKDMADETAYKVFTLLHLPLYFVSIFVLVQGEALANTILCYVIDVFLICHAIVHFGFRKNPNNGFDSTFSKIIIYCLGVLAIIHICLFQLA